MGVTDPDNFGPYLKAKKEEGKILPLFFSEFSASPCPDLLRLIIRSHLNTPNAMASRCQTALALRPRDLLDLDPAMRTIGPARRIHQRHGNDPQLNMPPVAFRQGVITLGPFTANGVNQPTTTNRSQQNLEPGGGPCNLNNQMIRPQESLVPNSRSARPTPSGFGYRSAKQ